MQPAITGALIGASAALAAMIATQIATHVLTLGREQRSRRATRLLGILEEIGVDLYGAEQIAPWEIQMELNDAKTPEAQAEASRRFQNLELAEARLERNRRVLEVYLGHGNALVQELSGLLSQARETGYAQRRNLTPKAQRREMTAALRRRREEWLEQAFRAVDSPVVRRKRSGRAMSRACVLVVALAAVVCSWSLLDAGNLRDAALAASAVAVGASAYGVVARS